MKMASLGFMRLRLSHFEFLFIVGMAAIPLFFSFPYRVNIFLSWEGAYRVSQGQLPFRDFGTPLGGLYWLIPGIFFKVFGPQMITLVKAQVFLNILSGLSFRSMLKSLAVSPAVRFLSVMVFVISYSFFNFWPWYNHTVIVYQLVSFACLFRVLDARSRFSVFVYLFFSALFGAMAFYTKQDAGAMCILITFLLLAYTAISIGKWRHLVVYALFVSAFIFVYAAAFSEYQFGYWFNFGQEPHSARVSFSDLSESFFGDSQWIKFYLLVVVLLFVAEARNFRTIWIDTKVSLFFLLTVAILMEAAVFQVTSYTPPDNNIFFHSFVFAFILNRLELTNLFDLRAKRLLAICFFGVLIWWSGSYWKYTQRVFTRIGGAGPVERKQGGENIVNRKTFMIKPASFAGVSENKWRFSSLSTLKGIYMPLPTIEGVERLMQMPILKARQANVRVLNMSELTSLAAEVPYKLETGSHYPLWFHLGVGMFNKQAIFFENRIREKYYDLVLFEHIRTLNNFYPFRVRDSLKVHYQLVDSFLAPRRGETGGMIEVYTR